MTLYTQYDADTGQYEIWLRDGKMSPMPAGGGGRWNFAHATFAEAECDRLRAVAYLAGLEKANKKAA